MSKQSKSGLSSVVSDLMRAAAGGDTSNVADEDIDKYVADILLQEAKSKNKKYNNVGIRAYLPNSASSPSTLPKMNKRFLLNVVKATDSHNQALIRATEEQAEANRQRMEQERYQGSDRRRRRSRSPSYRSKRPRHSRSRSPPRDMSRRTRMRSRSPSPSRSPHITNYCSDDVPPRHSSPEYVSSDSEKPIAFKGRGNITAGGPSAMDKYFAKSYDPSKDTGDVVNDDGWILESKNDQSSKKKKNEKKKKKKKKTTSKKREEEHDSRQHQHKKSKSKSKGKKEKSQRSDATTKTLDDGIVYSKGVREWDLEKKL